MSRCRRSNGSHLHSHTSDDLRQQYGQGCYYCGQTPCEHLDHYIPLSAGGAHTLDDLRPTCAACNMAKGSTASRQ
ncbi:HNH endonuclease [Flexivirga caeni]